MNKHFAKFLLILGWSMLILGWFNYESCAQRNVSREVIPNGTVHFGNLRAENKNLYVSATNPPNYLFDTKNVSYSDSRLWRTEPYSKGMKRPGVIKHWSEKIDTSKETLYKIYNPAFWGVLFPETRQ